LLSVPGEQISEKEGLCEVETMETKFGVWCEVWGGVTGSRAAWLKSDGRFVEFETYEAAVEEAEKNNKRTANNVRASFHYSARPLS
jgi:hypothetical protein